MSGHTCCASLVGAGATPSRCVPKCGQRDSACGRGCDALCDGGFWSLAGGDCVAPGEGELQLSAASGDAQLRLSAAFGRGCFSLRDGLLLLDQNMMPSAMLLSLLRPVAGTGNLYLQIVILTLVRHLCAVTSRPRSVGCARMNSCWDTHAARVNARGNSGGHANSNRCAYNSCGGVRGGTKPRSMSTRGQVWRPAAATRKVACRDVGRTEWEPQPADFPGGGNHAGVCGYGDSPSPSSLLSRVTWTGQRIIRNMGWVGH